MLSKFNSKKEEDKSEEDIDFSRFSKPESEDKSEVEYEELIDYTAQLSDLNFDQI